MNNFTLPITLFLQVIWGYTCQKTIINEFGFFLFFSSNIDSHTNSGEAQTNFLRPSSWLQHRSTHTWMSSPHSGPSRKSTRVFATQVSLSPTSSQAIAASWMPSVQIPPETVMCILLGKRARASPHFSKDSLTTNLLMQVPNFTASLHGHSLSFTIWTHAQTPAYLQGHREGSAIFKNWHVNGRHFYAHDEDEETEAQKRIT